MLHAHHRPHQSPLNPPPHTPTYVNARAEHETTTQVQRVADGIGQRAREAGADTHISGARSAAAAAPRSRPAHNTRRTDQPGTPTAPARGALVPPALQSTARGAALPYVARAPACPARPMSRCERAPPPASRAGHVSGPSQLPFNQGKSIFQEMKINSSSGAHPVLRAARPVAAAAPLTALEKKGNPCMRAPR